MDPIELRTTFFRGLADPSRQRIIELIRSRPLRVGEVVAETGLSQPTVSTHLACLWECGLAERERHGREIHYRLAAGVEQLIAEADRLLARVGERIESCPNHGRGRRRAA